jgi:hypothetical protein
MIMLCGHTPNGTRRSWGLLFDLCAYTPLPNLLSHRTGMPAPLGPAEAIVVLGGGVNDQGVLGESSLRRTPHDIMLDREGFAPWVAFLGAVNKQGAWRPRFGRRWPANSGSPRRPPSPKPARTPRARRRLACQVYSSRWGSAQSYCSPSRNIKRPPTTVGGLSGASGAGVKNAIHPEYRSSMGMMALVRNHRFIAHARAR